MAYVVLDVGGAIRSMFSNPQPQIPNVTVIADDDPRIAAFQASLVRPPSCQLWQLQAVLTSAQWAQVQTAVQAMNNPAVTAFASHGTNVIPANSTTLIALGQAIGLTVDQVTALVQQASQIVIP